MLVYQRVIIQISIGLLRTSSESFVELMYEEKVQT